VGNTESLADWRWNADPVNLVSDIAKTQNHCVLTLYISRIKLNYSDMVNSAQSNARHTANARHLSQKNPQHNQHEHAERGPRAIAKNHVTHSWSHQLLVLLLGSEEKRARTSKDTHTLTHTHTHNTISLARVAFGFWTLGPPCPFYNQPPSSSYIVEIR
jgi:hypothetical protein